MKSQDPWISWTLSLSVSSIVVWRDQFGSEAILMCTIPFFFVSIVIWCSYISWNLRLLKFTDMWYLCSVSDNLMTNDEYLIIWTFWYHPSNFWFNQVLYLNFNRKQILFLSDGLWCSAEIRREGTCQLHGQHNYEQNSLRLRNEKCWSLWMLNGQTTKSLLPFFMHQFIRISER